MTDNRPDTQIIFGEHFALKETLDLVDADGDGFRRYEYASGSKLVRIGGVIDTYQYKGEICNQDVFQGFLDEEQQIAVFNNGIFYQGRKINQTKAKYDVIAADDKNIYSFMYHSNLRYGWLNIDSLDGEQHHQILVSRFLGLDTKRHLMAVMVGNSIQLLEVKNGEILQSELKNEKIQIQNGMYRAVFSARGERNQDGEYKIKQSVDYNREFARGDILVGSKSRAILWNRQDDLSGRNLDIWLDCSQNLDQEDFVALFLKKLKNQQFDAINQIRDAYQAKFGTDIADMEINGKSIYQQLAEKVNQNTEQLILEKCFFTRFMQDDNLPKLTQKKFDDKDMNLNAWLEPVSIAAKKRLMMIERYAPQHPEHKYEFGTRYALYHLHNHPETSKDFDIDRAGTGYNSPYTALIEAAPVLFEKGINILPPEDFYLVSGEKLREDTLKRPFSNNQEHLLGTLDKIFGHQDIPQNHTVLVQAQQLLQRAIKENKLQRNDLDSKYPNLSAMVLLSGMLPSNEKMVESAKNAAAHLVDRLYQTNQLKAKAIDYIGMPLDEHCPVNETFIAPNSPNKSKTNLLDYALQKGNTQNVVWLLNHGADVMQEVERYSQKQNRNLPIKPFARYIDNLIYKKQTKAVETKLSDIAYYLDEDKEFVIDKIFKSLPMRTLQSFDSEKLKKTMHEKFALGQVQRSSRSQYSSSETPQTFIDVDAREKAIRYREEQREALEKLGERLRVEQNISKEDFVSPLTDTKNYYPNAAIILADRLERTLDKDKYKQQQITKQAAREETLNKLIHKDKPQDKSKLEEMFEYNLGVDFGDDDLYLLKCSWPSVTLNARYRYGDDFSKIDEWMEPFKKAKAAQIEAQRQAEMAAKIREKIKEQHHLVKNVEMSDMAEEHRPEEKEISEPELPKMSKAERKAQLKEAKKGNSSEQLDLSALMNKFGKKR